MRKIILLFAACLLSLQGIYAQNSSNVNHLNLCVGALYERGFDATLSYEHETKYHHSWEYFANAYIQYDTDPDAGHITKESFWHNYFTYNLGIAYKPCVIRGRNHHMGICASVQVSEVIQGKLLEPVISALSIPMISVVDGVSSGRSRKILSFEGKTCSVQV